MENIKSRSLAWNVAWVDRALSTLGIIWYILTLTSQIMGFGITNKRNKKSIFPELNDVPMTMERQIATWIIDSLGALFLCVNLWATHGLVKNTRHEADPFVALKKACIWRNINIVKILVDLTFAIAVCIISGSSMGVILIAVVVLLIAFRAFLLLCVWMFIWELQRAGANNNSLSENANVYFTPAYNLEQSI